jgi:hypothetical protein
MERTETASQASLLRRRRRMQAGISETTTLAMQEKRVCTESQANGFACIWAGGRKKRDWICIPVSSQIRFVTTRVARSPHPLPRAKKKIAGGRPRRRYAARRNARGKRVLPADSGRKEHGHERKTSGNDNSLTKRTMIDEVGY